MLDNNDTSFGNVVTVALFLGGLLGIAYSLVVENMLLALVFSTLPLIAFFSLKVLFRSDWIFYGIFIIAYFLMAWVRYTQLNGVSYFMDALLLLFLLQHLLQSHAKGEPVDWKRVVSNALIPGMMLWMVYCLFELYNSSSMGEAWIASRGLALNGFFMSLVAMFAVRNFKMVKVLLFVLSILTLLAVAKALYQKFFGWDRVEVRWLLGGGGVTHLLPTGTRYFSFFTDAGNFGSNMGAAGVVFACVAITIKGMWWKVYYSIVSLLGIVGLFYSGTRGAIAVPLGGFFLYSILSKNLKIGVPVLSALLVAFVLLAFTYVGQDNPFVRRMRTAVTFEEDGSFNVRQENQRMLGEYLDDKPFGVGLGLSGVENRKIADVYTTSIPHDSWYVKVWVETGIIGFIFYMGVLLATIAQASWRIMFKVKDPEIRGLLSGWLCGVFGMLVSAYGNAFWGQYPSNIIVYTGLVIALSGPYFEQQMSRVIKRS